ncbi:hypothetical protein G9A89_023461 [Geosiphon pyriformis]|nr:hypothetical protein G9A89_023461 [Geosiphon pyriformis]
MPSFVSIARDQPSEKCKNSEQKKTKLYSKTEPENQNISAKCSWTSMESQIVTNHDKTSNEWRTRNEIDMEAKNLQNQEMIGRIEEPTTFFKKQEWDRKLPTMSKSDLPSESHEKLVPESLDLISRTIEPKGVPNNEGVWKKKVKEIFRKPNFLAGENWAILSRAVATRRRSKCRNIFKSSTDIGLPQKAIRKGPWSAAELKILWSSHQKWQNNWQEISQAVGSRTPKQCSQYFYNRNSKHMKTLRKSFDP